MGVETVEKLASAVLYHLERGHWSRAHDDCVALVDLALASCLQACFVVDRIQFLDDFSLSVLRESLKCKEKERKRQPSIGQKDVPLLHVVGDDHCEGKVCFLCVHGQLYNWPSGDDMISDITRSNASLHVPIIEVCEASDKDLKTVVQDVTGCTVSSRWIETFGQASGGCVGYCLDKAFSLRNESGVRWREGKHGYTQLAQTLTLTVTPGKIKEIHQFTVHQVSADVAMKFAQVFDELPPVMQIACKVLAISARTQFYRLPRALLWETLNDLIAEGYVFSLLIATNFLTLPL